MVLISPSECWLVAALEECFVLFAQDRGGLLIQRSLLLAFLTFTFDVGRTCWIEDGYSVAIGAPLTAPEYGSHDGWFISYSLDGLLLRLSGRCRWSYNRLSVFRCRRSICPLSLISARHKRAVALMRSLFLMRHAFL